MVLRGDASPDRLLGPNLGSGKPCVAVVPTIAVARHVSLNWDAVGTMYGQHAFGLEPRGQY